MTSRKLDALGANAAPGDIERRLKARFFEYITNPIKVGQFMDSLNAALAFSQTREARAADEEPGESSAAGRS